MKRSGPVRVALVSGHHLFAECLAGVLNARGYDCYHLPEPAIKDAPNGAGADRLAQLGSQLLSLRPDVAIIDANRGPGLGGVTLVQTAAQARIAVAVLTAGNDQEQWGQHLAAGAHIVVPMKSSMEHLLLVIRRLGNGQPVLSRSEHDRLVALGRRRHAEVRGVADRLRRLSAKEAAVLRDLMAGRSVQEIATARGVAAATVRSQVKAVLAKLDVTSQVAAVAVAHLASWPANQHGP